MIPRGSSGSARRVWSERSPWARALPFHLIALIFLGSACTPDAPSVEGERVENLYRVFLGVAAFIFIVTAGLIGWSLIRYRARGRDDLPPQFHTNFPLELTWFAIPQAIVVVLFVLSVITLSDVNEQSERPDLVVDVKAFQWGWRFGYEGGVEVVGTPQEPAKILLPTGDIAFVLRSEDVVHAFYVPGFLIKRDVIPGRTTRIDVSLSEEGTYDGTCAEFCGLLHERMHFTIEVVPEQQFEDWLAGQGESS